MRQPDYDSLTLRQAEIAKLLVAGKSTREIALELTLSPRTIETHVGAIYAKYGVASRAELIATVLGASADAWANPMAPPPDGAKTNLPVRRGTLIGRARDIDNVVGTLQAKPLVTLTGAGGIGKTQVALAIGDAVRGDFADGVWLVELASQTRGSAVTQAFARALGVKPDNDGPLSDALVAYLRQKSLLLIVDNCEHVIADVATLVNTLLRSCPRLQILATSREPLRIADEQTYRLPSLGVPVREDAAGLSAAHGLDFTAIELFTQRAQAADFSFALDDDNAPIVADICRRLDGIPLAIELAAARVNILPLPALAAKIQSHLRILARGDRLALPRHQTMYALIDWSYQLLCADEQRLFACMSLFAGGCALAQIAAVASVEIDDDVATLDRLSSLVDKSLLVVGVHAGEPRYSLLKSLERYAAEKLELTGDSSRLRRRHADAYTVLAERLEADYDAAATDAWHAHAQIEMENFLTALDWTLDARHDIELGQRLAAALRPSWIIAGDAGRWLGIARELVNDRTPPPLAARLDFAAAAVSYAAADHEATLEAFTRLITVYRELGDPLRSAHAQAYAASALIFLGRLAEAEPLIAPALEIARQGGRPPLIAFVLRAGAFLSLRRGDVDGSRAALTEVLAIYERIGARRHQAVIIGTLAENEFVAGNVEYALQLAMECLGIQRELGWRTHFTRSNICAYNVALDRWELAHVQAREVLELARGPQATAALPLALLHLAAIAVLSTNDDGHSSPPESLARAAQLLGFVDARSTSVLEYTERQEYDRVLAALRTTIDADELAQRMAEGTLLTPDEATEIGLSL